MYGLHMHEEMKNERGSLNQQYQKAEGISLSLIDIGKTRCIKKDSGLIAFHF